MEHPVLDNPCLNIIYDSRRIEKYHPLMDELERQGIDNFQIWPCIIIPSIVDSIAESHKMIVRDAKERGLREVFIAEDDLYFPSINGWRYFLENKPKDFDIYFGGNYLPFDTELKTGTDVVGMHLYCISSSFYDEFLNLPPNNHIDQSLKDLSVYHFCYPVAALQRPGFSINNGRSVDYNENFWGKIYQ